MKRKHKSGVYAFLLAAGVLENGTPDEIALLKKQYWNSVKREWKKERLKHEHGFTVFFSDSELNLLDISARKHKLSSTKFIKQTTLAYIKKQGIPLDTGHIRELLFKYYNEIHQLRDAQMLPHVLGVLLIHKLEDLERELLLLLSNPNHTDSDY